MRDGRSWVRLIATVLFLFAAARLAMQPRRKSNAAGMGKSQSSPRRRPQAVPRRRRLRRWPSQRVLRVFRFLAVIEVGAAMWSVSRRLWHEYRPPDVFELLGLEGLVAIVFLVALAALPRLRSALLPALVAALAVLLGTSLFHRNDPPIVAPSIAVAVEGVPDGRGLSYSIYVKPGDPGFLGCDRSAEVDLTIYISESYARRHRRAYRNGRPPRFAIYVYDTGIDRFRVGEVPGFPTTPFRQRPSRSTFENGDFGAAIISSDLAGAWAGRSILFKAPWTSSRGAGSCVVTFPEIVRLGAWAAQSNAYALLGTNEDRGTPHPSDGGEIFLNLDSAVLARDDTMLPPDRATGPFHRWRCGVAANQGREQLEDCDVAAVIRAPWWETYQTLALILLGILISLVMEMVVGARRHYEESATRPSVTSA